MPGVGQFNLRAMRAAPIEKAERDLTLILKPPQDLQAKTLRGTNMNAATFASLTRRQMAMMGAPVSYPTTPGGRTFHTGTLCQQPEQNAIWQSAVMPRRAIALLR